MKQHADYNPSEILLHFAMEANPGRETLDRYLGEYPELAEDLIELSREILSEKEPPSVAKLHPDDLSFIERAWERCRPETERQGAHPGCEDRDDHRQNSAGFDSEKGGRLSANEENECPICARIEFDGGAACKVCRYPLPGHRVVEPADVYGCDVMIEVATGMVGTKMIEKHFKGSEATARRRAIMVKGFRRVVAVRPLRKEPYLLCYGEGRM